MIITPFGYNRMMATLFMFLGFACAGFAIWFYLHDSFEVVTDTCLMGMVSFGFSGVFGAHDRLDRRDGEE